VLIKSRKFRIIREEHGEFKAKVAHFGSNVTPALVSIEDDPKKKQCEMKLNSVSVSSMSIRQQM